LITSEVNEFYVRIKSVIEIMIKANNPALKSWLEVPADSDFPIQNLPFVFLKQITFHR
jgi:hypothetical protein